MCRTAWVLVLVLCFPLGLWGEEKPSPGATTDAEKFEVVIPTVTIDVEDTPLSDVLAELSKQAGVQLSADEGIGRRKVTLQVKDVPVLEALAAVAKLTGADIAWDFKEGIALLAYYASRWAQLRAVAGPCLLVSNGTARLVRGEWFFAPAVYVVARPVAANVSAPWVTEVLDPEGNRVKREAGGGADLVLTQLMTAVTPQRMPNVAEEPGQGVRLFDTQAILNWLDPRGPSPRTIRGTITVTFAAETAGVTFDVHRDLRREKEAGGVRVTYQEQQDEEEDSRGRPGLGYTFSVTGQLSLLSGLTVKDAAGGTVPSEWRTWVYRKDHLVLTLHLPGNAETVTFWVVTKPVIRTYPFEFTAAPPPEED